MLSYKDIKYLMKNKKARDMQGLFVTEGRKLYEEAPRSDIRQILISRSFGQEHPDILKNLPSSAEVMTDIDDARFASISDTMTPQGILTVVRQPAFSIGEVLGAAAPFYLILEDLQDPGNAGTILRTAEAAGVTAVFLTDGSVDLYSPKTVRSTMGSIFRVPHFYVTDAPAVIRDLAGRGVRTYAASLRGRRCHTDCDLRGGTAFVIGNESRGVQPGTEKISDECIRIPMYGRVESLNAAMAAGILMYETQRQRRLQL